VSKKEAVLSKFKYDDLLRLAISVSKLPMNNEPSREDLVRIIKDNLSLEEIEGRIGNLHKEIGDEHKEIDTPIIALSGMRLAGVGQTFLAIAFALYTVGGGTLYPPWIYPDFELTLAPLGLVSSILIFIFANLLGSSMFRLTRTHRGKTVGEAASLLGYSAAVIGIFYYWLIMYGNLLSGSPYYFTLSSAGALLAMAHYILLSSAWILLGAFFLMLNKQSGNSGLWLTTGTLYMIAGSFGLTTMLYPLLPLIVIIASLMGATCFLM
jgi:hypothetical protein